MNSVVIFSLEGIESNTEVNFFEGMGTHFSIKNLEIWAAGKQGTNSKASKRIKKIIERIEPRLLEMKYPLYVFFIGDGDALDDMKSMQRSMDTIMKRLDYLFNENEEIIMKKELIYEKNKSFDDVLLKNELIKKSGVINWKTKNHKKKSNKHLFRNIVSAGFKKNQKHSIEQDREFVKKIFKNTKYKKLVEMILNYDTIANSNN